MGKRKEYSGDIFLRKTPSKIFVRRNSFRYFSNRLSSALYGLKSRYYHYLRHRHYQSLKNKYYNLMNDSNIKGRRFRLSNKSSFSSNLKNIVNSISLHTRNIFMSKKTIPVFGLLLIPLVFFVIIVSTSSRGNIDEEVIYGYSEDTLVADVGHNESSILVTYNSIVDTISIYNEPSKLMLASAVFPQTTTENNYINGFYETLADDDTLEGDGTIGIEYDEYEIKAGDNLTSLSLKIGATMDTIVSVNKISNANRLRPGDKLVIPNRNGLLYTLNKNETLEDVSEKYDVSVQRIISFNRIENPDAVATGDNLFLPGARYTLDERIEKFGQIFNLPLDRITRVSSNFGYRIHPITKVRTLHRGIDFPGALNTPVYAARAGTVTFAGYSGGGFGNLVIIRHKDGYTTYYGHLNSVTTSAGRKVGVGSLIGRMGSTGRSTGSHLHLEIRRHGIAIDPNEYIPVKKYLRK